MWITSKPDLDNYLTRITEIEKVIIPTSVTVKNPSDVPANPPFWLHMASGQTIQKGSAGQWFITFELRILLVRQLGVNALGDWAVETVLIQDMIDVLWNFVGIDNYRNLKSASYSDIQAGFAVDSVMVSNQSRWHGNTVVGECLGSVFTLSFSHRMYNTPS